MARLEVGRVAKNSGHVLLLEVPVISPYCPSTYRAKPRLLYFMAEDGSRDAPIRDFVRTPKIIGWRRSAPGYRR